MQSFTDFQINAVISLIKYMELTEIIYVTAKLYATWYSKIILFH